MGLPNHPIPSRRIQIFQVLIFCLLFILWSPLVGNQQWIIQIVGQLSLLVTIIVYLIRKFSPVEKKKNQPGFAGLIWVCIFLIVYLVDYLSPMKPIFIILAGSAFSIVFIRSLVHVLLEQSTIKE